MIKLNIISSKLEFGLTSAANIDDIFTELYRMGVEDILVNSFEMHTIVRFYLANVEGDKDAKQGEVLRTGMLDKFFGINLHYYE